MPARRCPPPWSVEQQEAEISSLTYCCRYLRRR